MIDIKFLRENPDVVKENIKNKFQDAKLPLVDEVIELDKKSRESKLNGDNLRSQRKNLSNQIGSLMKSGNKEEAEKVKAEKKRLEEEAKAKKEHNKQTVKEQNDLYTGYSSDQNTSPKNDLTKTIQVVKR